MTRRPGARLVSAALLLAAGTVAACSRTPPPPRHVLLVVLDATHAAQLSCYGGPGGLTPALDALAARGVRRIDIACPGFAVDCLETLEEVALALAERAAAHGATLRYVPCLNAAPAHADALAALARRALAAWT